MIFRKEAQKCFCGTPACRGFIGGESSSAEASVPRREAATVRDVSKKKKEKTMQPSPFGDMLVSGRPFSVVSLLLMLRFSLIKNWPICSPLAL